MRFVRTLMLAAGCSLGLAVAANAQVYRDQTPQPHPGHPEMGPTRVGTEPAPEFRPGRETRLRQEYPITQPETVLRTDLGDVRTTPTGGRFTVSQLSPADQQALDEFYARQMLTSAILAQQLTALDEANQPGRAALYGRFLTEHLILATRARQVYRATNTPIPQVLVGTPVAAVPGEQWDQTALAITRSEQAAIQQRLAQAEDPRVRQLVMQAQELLAERPQVAIQYIAAAQGVAPADLVAGVRVERGDAFILTQFFTMQMMEAQSLREKAERLRETGQAMLADHFAQMATEHEALAQEASRQLQARNIQAPPVAEHPGFTGQPEALLRHTQQEHQHGLATLTHWLQEAESPEVRQLLERARAGTQSHMQMLQQHIQPPAQPQTQPQIRQ